MAIPLGAILRAIRSNRPLATAVGGAIGGGLGSLASDEDDSLGGLGGAILGGAAGFLGGGRKIRPQRFPFDSALSPDIHRWGARVVEAPSEMSLKDRTLAAQVDEYKPLSFGNEEVERNLSNLLHGGSNEAELHQQDLTNDLEALNELGLGEEAMTWLGGSTVPRSWDTARLHAQQAREKAATARGLGNMDTYAKEMAEYDRIQKMMADRTVATRNMSEEDFLSERAAQEARLGPEHYGKVSAFGKKFQDALWDLTTARHEAGELDPETYKVWKDQRDRGIAYFPAMRDSDEIKELKLPTDQLTYLRRMLDTSPEGALYQRPRAMRDYANRRGISVSGIEELEGMMRMEGSDLPLHNPLAAGFHYMEESFRQSKRNQAAKTFVDGAYGYAPPRSDGTPFIRELRPGEVLKGGEGAVSFLENGVPRQFAVPVEWADIMHGAEARDINKGLQVMSRVMRINSAMITGKNIGFIVPNVVKDLMDQWMLVRQNPKDTKAFLGWWYKAIKAGIAGDVSDPMTREAFSEGAVGGNITRQLRAEPSWMRAAGLQKEGVLNTIVDRLQNVTNATEQAPKIAAYRMLRERRGMSKSEAAFIARRDAGSPDFNRMGNAVPEIRPFVQFWSPQIQGIARNIDRAMKDPMYMASWAGALSAGYMALEGYNRSQINEKTGRPWIEDVPEYERENNIIITMPAWLADPVTFSNGVTRQPMMKIPLGHVAKILISPIRSIAMNAFGDPNAPSAAQGVSNVASKFLPLAGNIDTKRPIASFASQLGATATPVLRGPVEQFADYQAFSGRPIVGQRLEGLEAPEQYTESTSPTAVNIGRKLGLSPVRVEHALNTMLPGIGQEILNAGDLRSRSAMPGSEIATNAPVLGSVMSRFVVGKGSAERDRLSEELYESAGRADTIARTLNELKLRDPEAALDYQQSHGTEQLAGKRMMKFAKLLSQIRKQREAVLRDPGLSPQERTLALKDIEDYRMEILRNSAETLEYMQGGGIE